MRRFRLACLLLPLILGPGCVVSAAHGQGYGYG